MDYKKPLPTITVWNRPFWEACKEKKLTAQKCDVTGEVWFPPSPVSPATRTRNWHWTELSGRGRVVSWVVMHQVYYKGFTDDVPYLIAQIELEEGPQILSNVHGIDPAAVKFGMPVEVTFVEATDDITLPVFRPAA